MSIRENIRLIARAPLALAQILEVKAPDSIFVSNFVQRSSKNGMTFLGILR